MAPLIICCKALVIHEKYIISFFAESFHFAAETCSELYRLVCFVLFTDEKHNTKETAKIVDALLYKMVLIVEPSHGLIGLAR